MAQPNSAVSEGNLVPRTKTAEVMIPNAACTTIATAPETTCVSPPTTLAAIHATSVDVPAMTRTPCNQTQSSPSWIGNDPITMASMNPTSNSEGPSVSTGARMKTGTRTSKPRCSESQRRANNKPVNVISPARTSPP